MVRMTIHASQAIPRGPCGVGGDGEAGGASGGSPALIAVESKGRGVESLMEISSWQWAGGFLDCDIMNRSSPAATGMLNSL